MGDGAVIYLDLGEFAAHEESALVLALAEGLLKESTAEVA